MSAALEGLSIPAFSDCWLRERTVRLLRPIDPARATLRLVRLPSGEPGVTKDFLDAPPLYRRTVGQYLLSREREAYRRVQGVPGIPRLHACPRPDVLVMDYIPGVEVGQMAPGELPLRALDQLRETLEGIHRAGVLHMDLGHDSHGDFGRDTNMIWSDSGRLYVLDLAGALLARVPRSLFQVLARHDLLALTKLRRRFFGGGDPLPGEELPPWALRLFRSLGKL